MKGQGAAFFENTTSPLKMPLSPPILISRIKALGEASRSLDRSKKRSLTNRELDRINTQTEPPEVVLVPWNLTVDVERRAAERTGSSLMIVLVPERCGRPRETSVIAQPTYFRTRRGQGAVLQHDVPARL